MTLRLNNPPNTHNRRHFRRQRGNLNNTFQGGLLRPKTEKLPRRKTIFNSRTTSSIKGSRPATINRHHLRLRRFGQNRKGPLTGKNYHRLGLTTGGLLEVFRLTTDFIKRVGTEKLVWPRPLRPIRMLYQKRLLRGPGRTSITKMFRRIDRKGNTPPTHYNVITITGYPFTGLGLAAIICRFIKNGNAAF